MGTTNVRTLAALLAMTAGCTLVYSDEVYGNKKPKKQCSTASDCEKLAKEGDTNKYVCEQSLCQIAECLANTDCASMMCDTASHTCIELDASAEPPAKACKKDSDCDVKGGELCSPKDGFCYSKWGCLAEDKDWTDPANMKSSFTYKALMRSLQNPDDPTVLGAVTAMACPSSDPDCKRPTVASSAVNVTADKHITVPFKGVGLNGFVGTIRVQAELPPGSGGSASTPLMVLPGYFQFTGQNPLVNDTMAQDRAILIDTGTAMALAGLADVGDITKVANVVFLLYDCGGNKAANMTVDVQGPNQARFIPLVDEQTPDLSGTATGTYGAAFLAGAPEGFRTFVITDAKLGTTVTDSFAFNVFRDGINYVQYYPRYSALKKWMDYVKQNPNKSP